MGMDVVCPAVSHGGLIIKGCGVIKSIDVMTFFRTDCNTNVRFDMQFKKQMTHEADMQDWGMHPYPTADRINTNSCAHDPAGDVNSRFRAARR